MKVVPMSANNLDTVWIFFPSSFDSSLVNNFLVKILFEFQAMQSCQFSPKLSPDIALIIKLCNI